MRLTIEKGQLVNTLNIVSRGMASRSTMQILSCIHITATNDGVSFETTDLEISIRHITEALVEQNGSVVVSGKLFTDIIKGLPDAAVTLYCEQNILTISCLETRYSLNVLDAIDFPSFPQIIPARSFVLPTEIFAAAVKKVIKAVSKDESRAVLTGIFVKVAGDLLEMVATDSYRLAITNTKLEEAIKDPVQLIIPGSVMDDISHIANSKEIKIGEAENQLLFSFDKTTYISRKIEGNFPNYEQIVPTTKTVTATVETTLFQGAIKRASIMAQTHSSINVTLDPDDQQIIVSAQSQDSGSAEEKIPAQIDGEALEISFNHQYLLDGINVVETDEVLFEAQNSLKPGILKSVGGDYFFYLTMPKRA